MKSLAIRWALMVVAVVATSIICEFVNLDFRARYNGIGEIGILFVGVAVLAVLNATVGPLIRLLTLPLSCITLGLFSLVINGIVLFIAAQLNLGFSGGFVGCLAASLMIAFLNGMLGVFIPGDDKKE